MQFYFQQRPTKFKKEHLLYIKGSGGLDNDNVFELGVQSLNCPTWRLDLENGLFQNCFDNDDEDMQHNIVISFLLSIYLNMYLIERLIQLYRYQLIDV